MQQLTTNTIVQPMRRMRTLRQALEEIKSYDPNSALTYSAILSLCKENAIHNVTIGRKFYVDLDELINFFN